MGLLSTIGAASGRAFGFTRSAIAQAVDAYFNLTTLLLPGNGTNGAQNNTFLDSSSNTFSITRNGNATQGTFSPFSQTGWSNFFDGNGDYLGIGSNAVLSPGTGAFWIECWVNFSGFPASNATGAIFQNDAVGTSANDKFWFGLFNSSGTYQLTLGRHNTANKSFVNWTPTIGVWYHVAAARSGGTTYLFIDGVSQTVTNSTVFNGISFGQNGASIGAASSPWYFNGYISNFRYIVGAALYTSTFTPATTPLTTTSQGATASQVEILTCQDNRFIDNSSNAFAITVNGNSSVQAFSPFAPTAAYSAATNGGSGYFDGSGDYIITSSTSTNFNLGAGDFTAECWFYMTGAARTFGRALIGNYSGTTGWTLASYRTNDGWGFFSTINNANVITTTTQPALNAWNHVAFVRSGSSTNNTKIYLNGVQVAQATITTNESNNQAFWVGGFAGAGNDITQGYIASVRYIRGQALTTGDFTPPTAPVTTTAVGWTGSNVASSITGTVSILCNFTNAGITDATAKNVLETVGNAQISTTQSKFGGSSMYFDGTGDYLYFPSRPLQALGTSDFTIEFWFNASSIPQFAGIIDMRNPDTANAGWNVLFYDFKASFGTAGSIYIAGTTTLSTGTWYHYALTRSGNSFKQFLNGTQEGTTYTGSSTQNFTNTILQIGSGVSGAYTGYLDDVRITRGYARYTSNFTPPTAALPVQ